MIGELKPVAFPLPKTGEAVVDGVWLVANLARVKIEKYTKLFDRIGFAYSPTPGQDPGSGEFYLPGAAAAALIGQGDGGTFGTLGAVVGVDAAAIAAAELPVNSPWPLAGDPALNGDPALSGAPGLSGDPDKGTLAVNPATHSHPENPKKINSTGGDFGNAMYASAAGSESLTPITGSTTLGVSGAPTKGTLVSTLGTLGANKGTLVVGKGSLAAGQNTGGGQARSNVQRSLVIGGWLIRFADD